ncbi:MAG: DUF885 domain-containing protein [Candidatus Obscuribacterales bacterium]|nr:DUF885 domain-containing protein [Cyanobacteria bacterium HKST-UBA01]MCB9469629.1 DUF885 domain-containing protein [Candidatus Obscuribacterales bacterium]
MTKSIYTKSVAATLTIFAMSSLLTATAKESQSSFEVLADRFVKESLALSPTAASEAGYHRHSDGKTGNVVDLDQLLDDMSQKAMTKKRQFYSAWQERFEKETPEAGLNPQEKADWRMIKDQISLNLLDLENIQNYKYNPTIAVELIGSSIFQAISSDQAPKEVRLGNAIARVKQIPRLLKQVQVYMKSSVPIYIDTAIDENKGNIELIEKTLAEQVKDNQLLKEEYDQAAPKAVEALKAFSTWLKDDLAKTPSKKSWRLGRELYEKKFSLVMQTEIKPDDLLSSAEEEMLAVRSRMMQMAVPMHMELYPDHNHIKVKGKDRENLVIQEVLDKIADDHVKRDDLLDAVKGDLDSIKKFIAEKQIVSLSDRNNLSVIPTPPFMRGIYSVAGFHSAPPLEPEGKAEYWVTPIPASMSDEDAESKLREYNNFTLKWLTIHEALPGHYIQFEHLNNIKPENRRLLRSLYANGPYVEGWAEYIAQVMMDEGYMTGSRKFKLTMHKIRLRLLANAILDIKMHMGKMTDQEALSLMTKEAFQTKAEAEGKLRRAKLSSCQLPTYYVGLQDWLSLRERYQKRQGEEFNLKKFHDLVLDQGPLPIRYLENLL